MPTYAELGAQLLQDAATFFRTLAAENASVRQKMNDNAAAFDAAAKNLLVDPMGMVGDKSNAGVAAKYLAEASKLLHTLGDQNEPIREQMHTNADTYNDIALKLLQSPLQETN